MWPCWVGLFTAGLSCGNDAAFEQETFAPLGVDDCIVWLHGKSERGVPSAVIDDVGQLSPSGNGRAGGGREWRYFPDAKYDEARRFVADAIDESECQDVAISGFSNGGAFAAKLYCRGETFDGRLIGVVVDDPPPDQGTIGCAPDPGVEVALYWTGALDDMAQAGASCGPMRWTCEGDALVGIEAYASALGTEILESPFDEHVWHRTAPELDRWMRAIE